MDSSDVRSRIAEIEAARQRSQSQRGPDNDDPDPDDLSWEALFGTIGGAEFDDFSFNEWLGEGLSVLRSTLRGAGVDDEFWRHLRAAERELLLAARHLLDVRLEAIERAGQQADEGERLQEINIDFE